MRFIHLNQSIIQSSYTLFSYISSNFSMGKNEQNSYLQVNPHSHLNVGQNFLHKSNSHANYVNTIKEVWFTEQFWYKYILYSFLDSLALIKVVCCLIKSPFGVNRFFFTSVEWLQLSERTSCSLPTYYSGLSLGKLLETSKLIWNTELEGPDWDNWRHCQCGNTAMGSHCIIVLVVFLTWMKAMMNVMVLKMFVSFNCLSLAFTIFTVLLLYCKSLKNKQTFQHRQKLKENETKNIYVCEFLNLFLWQFQIHFLS